MRLVGAAHRFDQCTFANYYLFSAIGGANIQFGLLKADEENPGGLPLITAEFTNSIVYGNGTSLSHGDLSGTGVFFRYCLIKEAGTDDANFISCIWDKDPLYYTVREDYIFDYRLKPESPAIGAGSAQLMLPESAIDYYGRQRGTRPDLGAYVYTPPSN